MVQLHTHLFDTALQPFQRDRDRQRGLEALGGLAHDVGTQLRNKNGLTLDFLLFLDILKCSGRKTSKD